MSLATSERRRAAFVLLPAIACVMAFSAAAFCEPAAPVADNAALAPAAGSAAATECPESAAVLKEMKR